MNLIYISDKTCSYMSVIDIHTNNIPKTEGNWDPAYDMVGLGSLPGSGGNSSLQVLIWTVR